MNGLTGMGLGPQLPLTSMLGAGLPGMGTPALPPLQTGLGPAGGFTPSAELAAEGLGGGAPGGGGVNLQAIANGFIDPSWTSLPGTTPGGGAPAGLGAGAPAGLGLDPTVGLGAGLPPVGGSLANQAANMAAMGGDAALTNAALTGTGASGLLNGALQSQLLGDAGTLGLR